jgi:pimeloyl-ACP methyl ester carboxylesterase
LRDAGRSFVRIETIPKRGYRFVSDLEVLNEAPGGIQKNESQKNGSHAAALHADGLRTPSIPKTHYVVRTGDVNIAYQMIGDGPLDLVFVMGWVSHLEYFWREPSFARFLTRLASFSRLILFDKRGTGLSDRAPLSDLPSLEQRMTDAQAVMDAVGSERAALMGVSEGGPMYSLFAATHPERTEAFVMIGTYAKRIRSVAYPWAPTKEARAGFLEEMKKNWGGPVGLEERVPSAARDPQFREWWSAYLRLGASLGAAIALTRMNAEIDVRNVLPSIRVPSLVIHRAGDTCLPVEGGRYVASRIPGAKYVELGGEDHLPFVGSQDEILDEVEEFLTGARPNHQIDRVLATVVFVFLDDNPPQHAKQTIETYQSHARRELALFRGKEIEMTDEYLFASFDGPARAIRCARAIANIAARLGLRARVGFIRANAMRLERR